MVQITEELIRKKSEHNECLIGTLEEIALHQENIEKIEHIQHWCKGLKILLLQNNLISKIENLHKLKSLEYLNLAINNIEKIENLEGLESLQKLDLTLNFIGHLTDVEHLKYNYNLEILYLTGNPCTDYENYREYVIATLPQIKYLDDRDISHSDRIRAMQKLKCIRPLIIEQQIEQRKIRQNQKVRVSKLLKDTWEAGGDDITDEDRTKRFWESKCEHCPETRTEMSKMSIKARSTEPIKKNDDVKPVLKFFSKDGRPFCMNQPKLEFMFLDKTDHFVLDLAVYKFLDTSLCQVDVQPNYIRVTIKGKVFQMALLQEVNTTKSVVQRSQMTGHLVITMPKINSNYDFHNHQQKQPYYESTDSDGKNHSLHEGRSRREYLEIGAGPDDMDFSKILERSKIAPKLEKIPEPQVLNANEDVPPLE